MNHRLIIYSLVMKTNSQWMIYMELLTNQLSDLQDYKNLQSRTQILYPVSVLFQRTKSQLILYKMTTLKLLQNQMIRMRKMILHNQNYRKICLQNYHLRNSRLVMRQLNDPLCNFPLRKMMINKINKKKIKKNLMMIKRILNKIKNQVLVLARYLHRRI